MPDYGLPQGEGELLGTTTAGLVGVVMTFVIVGIVGLFIIKFKARSRKVTHD